MKSRLVSRPLLWAKVAVFGALVGASLATGPVAYADDPAPAAAPKDRFAGNYTFVGGQKQKDALEAAIDKATDDMSFITRPIARSRLREKTKIRATMGFAFGGGNITWTASDVPAAVSPEDGSYGSYKSGSDTLKLSQKINAAGQLLQSFVAEDGSRKNTYTLSADGKTLTVNIVLTSSKLPAPVSYALTYQKK